MILLTTMAWAAVPASDPNHANHFVAPEAQQVQGVSVEVRNPWAREKVAKATVVLRNRSSHAVLFQPLATSMTLGEQTLQPHVFAPHEKTPVLYVEPGGVVDGQLIFRGAGLHADSGELALAGLQQFDRGAATVVSVPDLQLPLKTRALAAGPVACTPDKVKQQTDATRVKLSCTYEGQALLFVDASEVRVRLEDGGTFPNDARSEPVTVQPDGTFDLDLAFHVDARIVDMQFATLQVDFGETFREGVPTQVPLAPAKLVFDPERTDANN